MFETFISSRLNGFTQKTEVVNFDCVYKNAFSLERGYSLNVW